MEEFKRIEQNAQQMLGSHSGMSTLMGPNIEELLREAAKKSREKGKAKAKSASCKDAAASSDASNSDDSCGSDDGKGARQMLQTMWRASSRAIPLPNQRRVLAKELTSRSGSMLKRKF